MAGNGRTGMDPQNMIQGRGLLEPRHTGPRLYGVRNHEKTIRFSLKSRLSERFHWPEMFQIKTEISLHTNVKLIFYKNVGWQGYQWIP